MGNQKTDNTINRNYSAILATLQINRQTSGESASLPQYLGSIVTTRPFSLPCK